MSEQIESTEDAPLEIQEASAASPTVKSDGTAMMHLIRPCVGRGKGSHLYEASMLAKNAGVFAGWKMYVDHDSEGDRKARGGLPRSVRHLGGIVTESHWDPSVPAEGRFGQGAVVGTVRAVPMVQELLKLDPGLVESSINARATSVKPVMHGGQKVWLVEGIEPRGSVDWVTEAGAGGKVVSLLEAITDGTPDEEETALFETLTDEEIRDYLAKNRPSILEAAKPKKDAEDTGPGGDGGADEDLEDEVARLMKKGMPKNLATKAAKANLAKKAQEAADDDPDADPDLTPEGGAVATVTPEDIAEALASPAAADVIGKIVEEQVATKLSEAIVTERREIRAEAYADAGRQIEIRDLRDTAHTLIREAKLPSEFEKRALAKFTIVDGEPSDPLDVFEAIDDDGKVTQTAEEALRESVEAEIAEQRGLVASISKTRVRGQGASAPAGDGEEGKPAKQDRLGDLTRSMLTEAGFNDPDKAFDSAHALRG